MAHFWNTKSLNKKIIKTHPLYCPTRSRCQRLYQFYRNGLSFSTTSHVLEATKLLLDFVQKPHFTEESVEAEVGIIEQELKKMYMDRPGTALMQEACR